MTAWARADRLPRPGQARPAALARRLALFAALLGAVASAAHRFQWIETEPFLAVLAVVLGLVATAFVLVAAAWKPVWVDGKRGGTDMVLAVAVGLLILTPFGWAFGQARSHPALSDIATDLDDPPALRTGDRTQYGEEARALQAANYPEVAGRRYALPADRLAELCETLMRDWGWSVGDVVPGTTEISLRASARTLILGYPSDVAVRITDEGETSFVDMRSRSRFGSHDAGSNAERIETFLAELDTRVSQVTVAPVAAPAE
ncbi:MAG: DUF1499 domain-containing protein [Mesorhizobium amorphae]|nr:MAG: DUF1499 domain-containing protein [Mesorhizobium amorphae]